MKKKFRSVKFRAESLDRIRECNEIILGYQEEGLRLTLRQLYYQLVTRNLITNEEKSYKTLGSLVSDARLAGLMDWDAIEDRVRRARRAAEWNSIRDLIETAIYSFRLPRWEDQKGYVELWVEKDALAGVLEPIANEYHITLMVNRGYSSQSAMYESAKRFCFHSDQHCVLLYLGDLDPSGEDMVRDIDERLDMFGAVVAVEKIALTKGQVQRYKPPPNPAKMTDPRAKKYREEHGDQSWEVDALPPQVLQKIIRDRLDILVDKKKMDAVKRREKEAVEAVRRATEDL